MIETTETVWFGDRAYYGGKIGYTERGSFCLDLRTTPDGGGYFTCIPVSPAEFRKKFPTEASAFLEARALIVTDDWGTSYRIRAPDRVLHDVLRECREHGLDERS